MNHKEHIPYLLLIVGIGILAIVGFLLMNTQKDRAISSFDECTKAGFPVMESYPRQCRAANGKIYVEQIENPRKPTTITGTVECLPHKDTSGPQTMECAFGIKDSNGTHYGLNDPEMKYITQLATGKKISVTGKFMPNTNSIYDSIGTIEVTQVTAQ